MSKHFWNDKKVIQGILTRHAKHTSLASRTVRKEDSSLMTAAGRYYGGWAQAVEAAGINYENVKTQNQTRIFWDKDKIKKYIITMAEQKFSLQLASVKKSNPKLVKASVKYFGSWANAVNAAGLDYVKIKSDARNYKWDKDKIIRAIQKRNTAHQTLSSAKKGVALHRLINASLRHFGSWRKAIEAAGIDYDHLVAGRAPAKKWNEAKVIKIILSRKKKGLTLSHSGMQKERSNVLEAGRNIFGSWKKSIEAAGINYKDVCAKRPITKWGKENVVKAIQQRFKEGLLLNSEAVQTSNMQLYGAARRYLGSWQNAIEAAGFSYTDIRLGKKSREWNKNSIVKAIKQRKRAGLALNGQFVQHEDQGLYTAAKRCFGRNGWRQALIASGINPKDVNGNRKWTKQKILGRIKKLHREGKPLYAYALKKTEGQSFTAGASSYFGSWRQAIEAAGLKWSDVRGQKKYRWWTKNRVIYRIKYYEQKGVTLSSVYMKRNHGDLFATARNFFGSWSEAVDAAGIDYLSHSKVWSTKAWLRTLTDEGIQGLESHTKDFLVGRRENESTKIKNSV